MNVTNLVFLLLLSAVDVAATLWTINFIRHNKDAVQKVREERNKEPTNLEVSFIPRLIMVLKLPQWISYVYPIVVISCLFLFIPQEREHLFFFMLGCYMIVLQIHWANYRDLKEVEEGNKDEGSKNGI